MKIVLANLPWKKNNQWGVRAGSRWPHIKHVSEKDYLPFPFYLSYAAALLRKNGFAVELIDAIALKMTYEKFYRHVRSLKPDLLVAETATVCLAHDLEVLNNLADETAIALCGPDVHIAEKQFLAEHPGVDYVMYGEYEVTLLELAQTLRDKGRVSRIDGLLYRENGAPTKNPPRLLIQDLDALPWPLRDALPIKRYSEAPCGIPTPCATMWASRGCPFRCSFCLWPQVMYNGSNYRARSNAAVIDEMAYLVNKMGFRSIYFDDDTWNIGRERIVGFCEELKRRDMRVPWAIMARPALMDHELLRIMKAAGLFAVKYGVESASQELVDNVSKGIDLNKVQDIIKFTHYVGIRTHLTFTFGLPGETRQTVEDTINLAINLQTTSVQFSLATPFPGTRFYEEMDKQGFILTKEWDQYDNSRSVIRTAALTAEDLHQAKNEAYRRWIASRRREDFVVPGRRTWRACVQKVRTRIDHHRARIQSECGELKTMVVGWTANGREARKRYGVILGTVKHAAFVCKNMLLLGYDVIDNFERVFEQRFRLLAEKKFWMPQEVMGDELGFALRLGRGKIKLIWRGQEISRDVGCTTSFNFAGIWYDSSLAEWTFERRSETELGIYLQWKELPVAQRWQIRFDARGVISWQVALIATEPLHLVEYKAGLMVPEAYRFWHDDRGKGRFPRIVHWQDIPVVHDKSRVVGVDTGRQTKTRRFPAIDLVFKEMPGHPAYAQVQNTDRRIQGRVLQMQRFQIEPLSVGEHPVFDLEIRIAAADAAQQASGLAAYHRLVPLRFLWEKIRSRGTRRLVGGSDALISIAKVRDYYADIMGVLDGRHAYKGPSFVQIDVTNNCNNDCIGCWCNSPLLKEKRIPESVKNQTLPLGLVLKTIDELQAMGAREIYFAGGGEPFMHPQMLDIIRHVKQKGLRCYINTNFTLVTQEIARELVALQVDHLIVSIWAGTPQTYAATHPNKSEPFFDQLKGTLKFLNYLKKDAPQVNMYNVISNLNYHELEAMIQFGIETGCNSVEFTVIDTIPQATDALLLTDEQRLSVLDTCGRIRQRLQGEWRDKIAVLQFEQFVRRMSFDDARHAQYDRNILTQMPCYIGWLFSRILADGNVNFCLKAHRIPVGNLYTQSFRAIWNSPTQQLYRATALAAPRDDPFFSRIGNDPEAKNGCYKSCDDLARNTNMHKKMQSLTLVEREFWRTAVRLYKLRRFFSRVNAIGRLRQRLTNRRPDELYRSRTGKLQVSFCRDGIRFFWQGQPVTKLVGLNAAVRIYGVWHNSSQGTWRITRRAGSLVTLVNEWGSLPLVQTWRVRMDRLGIAWDVSMTLESDLEFEEKKVSLLLSPAYQEWFTDREAAAFPPISQWQEMPLHDLRARSVGVKALRSDALCLPEITLSANGVPAEVVPQIQNSDGSIAARILSLGQRVPQQGERVPAGTYQFFTGRLTVRDTNE